MKGLSLRTKVFLLFAGTTLLTVIPALMLVAEAVEDRVYERATQELLAARHALRTYWQVQDEALLEKARRVALEPAIVRSFEEGDSVVLRKELRRRVTDGRIVIAADSSGTSLVGPVLDSVTLSSGGGSSLVVVVPGEPLPIRLAMWPVWTDSGPAGVVGVGQPLDAKALKDLKTVTGVTDVALVMGDSLYSTTLPDSLPGVLRGMDLRGVVERGGVWRRSLETLPYLHAVYSLETGGAPGAVLLFRPVADELRVARGIVESLVVIGVVAIVLSLLLAFVVARIVARPAQVLAAASADLARGAYGAPLPTAAGDEIGQLTRAFAEMRSAIAEREARLRSAQAELIHREKLAAMGRLVAQLSHEINNPIYNIQNCLEALERRGDPNDPNREFLILAQEELQRMAALTRQLLDQSRPLPDAATALDLNSVVRRVVALAASRLEAEEVEARLELDSELPPVVAHPDAVQQVLANLVDNAIDSMPGGGALHLSTTAYADAVEVAVVDTGAGIAEEDLPHIFEAFYTTKPGVTGIGLGLFVSEGIIRGHRGSLAVQSRPGEGSRFVIRLPRETLDPTATPADHVSAAAAS